MKQNVKRLSHRKFGLAIYEQLGLVNGEYFKAGDWMVYKHNDYHIIVCNRQGSDIEFTLSINYDNRTIVVWLESTSVSDSLKKIVLEHYGNKGYSITFTTDNEWRC